MKREVKFTMPYIGSDLSVNHYLGRRKGGGYFVKQAVKDWMVEFGWKIKLQHVEDWKLPLRVECSARFADKRVRDLSNFSKVCLDAIEEVSGVNDTNMRWHDGDIAVDPSMPPTLFITIREGE